MHRRIERMQAELLICRSPASIYNYILSAVLGVFDAKRDGFWASVPDPGGGAYSAPPHPLAGLEGCPPPAPSPGRPAHYFASPLAPPSPVPPPPLPISGSTTDTEVVFTRTDTPTKGKNPVSSYKLQSVYMVWCAHNFIRGAELRKR